LTTGAARASGRLGAHARGAVVGFGAGLVAVAIGAVLPDPVAYIYFGAQLAAIGWVYFGFGVADGRPVSIAVQVVSASVFLTIGFLAAYHQSTVLLGLGFIAHGAWDWVHHDGHGPTHVRSWYPPFCVTVDVVTGVPLLAGWLL
jgi:hypothetical protein